jgi:uncharacterized protein (UPF0147 family)
MSAAELAEVDIMAGESIEINDLIKEILENRGVPRNIKLSLEDSINTINNLESEDEKISCIISVLDDASNDPNLSSFARTQIWNMVSVLEEMKK